MSPVLAGPELTEIGPPLCPELGLVVCTTMSGLLGYLKIKSAYLLACGCLRRGLAI